MKPSKPQNRITRDLIAPCGMNCGICRAFLREKNPCNGCNFTEKNMPKTRINCKMRTCTKRTGKFCYRCSEFPCDRLLLMDKRYRTKYGMSEIENLEFIREYGISKFVASEGERWISEKGIFCVHDRKHHK
jgi:hypothetical protein